MLDPDFADKVVARYINYCGSVTLDVITENKSSICRLTDMEEGWSPSSNKEFNLHVFSVTAAYGCRALDGLVQEFGARDAKAVRAQLMDLLIARMSNKHGITVNVFRNHLHIAESSISDSVARDKLLTICLALIKPDFSPPVESNRNLFASWLIVGMEFHDAIMGWKWASEKVAADAGL
jgi:hypothetical protein